jgi:hypothetical protein
MSATISWISDVLGKFQLRQNVTDDFHGFLRYRSMVDRARLVERMNATCDAINSQAGRTLIYYEELFQPNELARRYVFDRDNIEFRMSLAILSKGPTVIFSTLKTNYWGKWINRRIRYSSDEVRESVVCEVLINPETVNDAELERWFTYLLSGLRYSFKPAKTMP